MPADVRAWCLRASIRTSVRRGSRIAVLQFKADRKQSRISAKSLHRIPLNVEGRGDVACDLDLAFPNTERAFLRRPVRHELSNRLSVLAHNDGLASRCDLVDQGKAFGLEFGGLHPLCHGGSPRITMVMSTVIRAGPQGTSLTPSSSPSRTTPARLRAS